MTFQVGSNSFQYKYGAVNLKPREHGASSAPAGTGPQDQIQISSPKPDAPSAPAAPSIQRAETSKAGGSSVATKLIKIAAAAASGALLGAGMAAGGAGGLVCGLAAGAIGGLLTFGRLANRSRSDGELLTGLGGVAVTTVAGGVAGAFGVPEGMLLVGGGLGLIQSARSLLKD